MGVESGLVVCLSLEGSHLFLRNWFISVDGPHCLLVLMVWWLVVGASSPCLFFAPACLLRAPTCHPLCAPSGKTLPCSLAMLPAVSNRFGARSPVGLSTSLRLSSPTAPGYTFLCSAVPPSLSTLFPCLSCFCGLSCPTWRVGFEN